jgi:hypothetical protein
MEHSTDPKPPTIWTDANKKALREALGNHSDGRYSNLANAKGKWKLVVAEFHAKTDKLVVSNVLTKNSLQNLIHLLHSHQDALIPKLS